MVERFGNDSSAAFLAVGALADFDEEMFERAEKVGAEPAPTLLCSGKAAAAQDAREEILWMTCSSPSLRTT